MRFKKEANDPANAGLSIIRDMLHPVAVANPGVSSGDLWTAGKSPHCGRYLATLITNVASWCCCG